VEQSSPSMAVMFETLAKAFVCALTACASLGLLFAVPFSWFGAQRMESEARGRDGTLPGGELTTAWNIPSPLPKRTLRLLLLTRAVLGFGPALARNQAYAFFDDNHLICRDALEFFLQTARPADFNVCTFFQAQAEV
jgi:hypothetical protein